MFLLTYIKWNGSHSPRAKSFLLDLFYPCDLNSRTAYLPAEESALLFTTTFESRTSCLLRSVIDSLWSWRAEGGVVSNRQNVARHFEHFNGRSWSSSLQRGHFILCVLGNLFPSTSKGRHLSCERALFYQKRKMSCFLEATPEWYRSFGRVITWDQALFSFRFENYIPAGKAKRKESLIQTFNEMSAAHFFDWLTLAESANQNYFRSAILASSRVFYGC